MVRRAVGELDRLVLDRGAIARAGSLDRAGVERREMQVLADHGVRALVGAGQPAQRLVQLEPLRPVRERHRRLVAGLRRDSVPVDRVAVEARRSPGLEPAALEPQLGEALGERHRRVLPDAPAREPLRPDVNEPVQERAGGDDGRAAIQHPAVGKLHRAHSASLEPHVVRHAADAREPRDGIQVSRHLERVARLVALRARRPHRRPAPAVQHLELDPGAIGHDPHHAAERVDLAHHVALRDPADRGIARHLGGIGEAHGEERGAQAEGDARAGRLAARMPGADHDHVERSFARASGGAGGRLAHAHFPMQKRLKMRSSRSSPTALPVTSPIAARPSRSSSATISPGSPRAAIALARTSASRARVSAST